MSETQLKLTTNDRWLLAATIIGSGMASIDSSAVNVILPTLQDSLDATVTQLLWVVEAYVLFLGALILVGGALGDRYGRRRIYALGILIFTSASLWSALSATASELIIARAAQGIGGALLVPGSLSMISALVPKARRGLAIGTWSAFTAIAATAGPVLGGWLADTWSWRLIFFINVPLSIVALGILYWRVPESREPETSAPDLAGATLATAGLGASIFALIEANNRGLSDPLVLATLIVGIALLLGFAAVESRHKAPMVPSVLFKNPVFRGMNVITLFLYGALGGALYFLPFVMIQVHGYSATQAGAAFLPLILMLVALGRASGRLVDKHGARPFLIAGSLLASAGYMLLALAEIDDNYWTGIFPGMTTLGLGMGLIVAPLTTAVMGAVETRYVGVASGVNNAASRIAGLLAVAVMGLILVQTFNVQIDRELAAIDIPTAVRSALEAQRHMLLGARLPDGISATLSGQVRLALTQAFLAGYRAIMTIAAVLALASAITAWYAFRQPAISPDQPNQTDQDAPAD
jgi:EmrB/QacA subfamily drug resistance transporter